MGFSFSVFMGWWVLSKLVFAALNMRVRFGLHWNG